MSGRAERRRAVRIIIIAAATAVLAAALSVGITFARERASRSQPVTVKYDYSPDEVFVLEPETDALGEPTDEPVLNGSSYDAAGDWTFVGQIPAPDDKDVYQKTFLLSNASAPDAISARDSKVGAVLFVTEGAANEFTSVRLEAGGLSYIGDPVEAGEDDPLYKKYGPGYVYRFTDGAGEPIRWDLKGGVLSTVQITVTVWCRSEFPAAMYLIASSYPAN